MHKPRREHPYNYHSHINDDAQPVAVARVVMREPIDEECASPQQA
jgi:hypothetical protein